MNFSALWQQERSPEPNSVALKMNRVRYFETSDGANYAARCSNPKDHNLSNSYCENLKNFNADLIIRTRNLRQVTSFLNSLLLFADFRKLEPCIFVRYIGEVLLGIRLKNRSIQQKGGSMLVL